MDFVKIKENIFVIIIGILFVGALAAAIVGFINKQQASDVIGWTQSNIIDAFSRSVWTNYMERHTIYGAFEKKLKNATLGKYSISLTTWVVYAASTSGGVIEAENDTVLINSDQNGLSGHINPASNTLLPLLAPETALLDTQREVNGTWNSWFIKKDTLETYTGSNLTTAAVNKDVKPVAKGFITNGYFGFVWFGDKDEAIKFQDKFMPNSFVVKVDGNNYGIVMPFGQ